MSKKDNLLWKLDVLQVKFEKITPRYGTTKAILKSKDKKKIDKIIGKNTNHIKAKEQILALQTDICERKFHSSLIKLNRILKKNIKTISNKSKNTDINPLNIFINENGDKQLDDLVHSKIVKIAESVFTKTKLSKLNPPGFLPNWCKLAIRDVNNEYNPKFQYKKQTQEINNLISKLYNDKSVKELLKSIEASFAIILGPVDKELSNAKELEDEAKEDSESDDDSDDSDDSSDSDDDESESHISKKNISNDENSGEPHQYDPDLLCDQYKAYVIGTDDEEEEDEEPDFKNSSVNYNEVTDEEPSEDEEIVDADAVNPVDQEENDIEMADKLYDQYKDYVGGSSDEDEGEEIVLDKEIDYEQVTDEEPSEEEEDIDLEKIQEIQDKEFEDAKKIKKSLMNDEFFEEDEKDRKKREKKEKKEKKQKDKLALPALATGYYSGGESDSDVDKDEVVQQATKVRKNRRGQRARQKIWEKKFGTGANHVKKESERVKSDKERKKLEFEERARKRMEKQKIIDEKNLRRGYGGYKDMYDRNNSGSSSNNNNRYDSPQPQADKPEKLHPSWEAKKKAEESLQNVKFSGKKITFD